MKVHVVDWTEDDFRLVKGQGKRYEDLYGGYLEHFYGISQCAGNSRVEVRGAPWCWTPLLYHLNCEIVAPRVVFDHCPLVKSVMSLNDVLDRTAVEVLCGFRPETVDALWKIDCQWLIPAGRVRRYPRQQEFIVTNNGSYFRSEVQSYLSMHLEHYVPSKKKVLLVPCAADKPYPAPLHTECLRLLPKDFYLCNATGVVGLVPQELWSVMPFYDSGIPNQWRLYEIAKDYFSKHHHSHIVVYCDFYAHVLKEVFDSLRIAGVRYALPPVKYDDYLNLMSPTNLAKLKEALTNA